MRTLVTASHLFRHGTLIADPFLLIEDGHIAELSTRAEQQLPEAEQHHDYPGAILCPAYFDVHMHGCCGRDVMEGTGEAVSTVNTFLAKHGVGAYLPTTITAPKDTILRSLEALAQRLNEPRRPAQARPLGLHLEGPFLSHQKRGTHPAHQLLEPSIPFFNAMYQAAEGRITLMTIAPELPGALELIAHAVSLGVRVSIGHSNSLSAPAYQAIELGATSATHTFNAMRPFDHREPGILGAVLATDELYAELICDGIHLDPAAVRLFARAKPRDRAILITDAMSATGMPDGSYKLGELDVRVTAGRAITGADTLAGSTLTLDAAVRNYMRESRVSLADSLLAVTENPGRMTGMFAETAALHPGADADFNLLSPEGQIQTTYLLGERV